MLDFESTVTGLMAKCGWDRATAERRVRSQLSDLVKIPAEPERRTIDREKLVEHRGDQLMRAHGFTVIRFSQARKTMQTPGIPDRRYYRPGRVDNVLAGPSRGLAPWWEAKAEDGEQSPAQREFQELVEACGETYLLGTDAVLRVWLEQHGMLTP